MADYSYIAIEKSGKEIKGSMESDSREKVEQKLRSQGCIPLEIKEQNALQKDIKIGVGKKSQDKRSKRVLPSVCKYAPCRSQYSGSIRYAVDTDRK